MLSVSPPLHQDFRARHVLCSPGDGWRAYVPPPLPTVQPAFHFLTSLLDPQAYAPVQASRSTRPTLDRRFHGRLAKALDVLPNEIMRDIVGIAVEGGSGADIALASRYFNSLATPFLYKNVKLQTINSIRLFNRTVEASPDVCKHIRCIHFEPHRLPVADLHRLVELLGDTHIRQVQRLSVRMPASDLHLMMDFLRAFQPVEFEWRTSPCWQMNPKMLFVAFLSQWGPTLRDLTLSNFRFDDTVRQCLANLPQLEILHLGGNGTEHLEANLIARLLTEHNVANAGLPFRMDISQCSQERLLALQSELTAKATYDNILAGEMHRISWSH